MRTRPRDLEVRYRLAACGALLLAGLACAGPSGGTPSRPTRPGTGGTGGRSGSRPPTQTPTTPTTSPDAQASPPATGGMQGMADGPTPADACQQPHPVRRIRGRRRPRRHGLGCRHRWRHARRPRNAAAPGRALQPGRHRGHALGGHPAHHRGGRGPQGVHRWLRGRQVRRRRQRPHHPLPARRRGANTCSSTASASIPASTSPAAARSRAWAAATPPAAATPRPASASPPGRCGASRAA